MAYEIVSLQGFTFEVVHQEMAIPEDAPVHPAMPAPGSTVQLHQLRFMDMLYNQQGQPLAVRKVYEVDLDERQRDEMVRQLQGGVPQHQPGVLVATTEALRHLPPQPQPNGG